jgi:hypothetical protein
MSGPDPAEREALRRKLLDAVPGWYRPWAHFAVPSLFGLGIIAACIVLIRDLSAWELVTLPLSFVVSNINEWRAHKYLLHKRSRLAPVLYDRHTPEHHMVYVTEDMAMRERREFRLVLIPAYGIMLIFVGVSVPATGLWLLGLENVALLFVAAQMAYVLSYEWLHLSYHLPPDSFIGRRRLIRRLRRHHAIHHDPRLMQHWNFNVTVPLWDWVRGTIAREEQLTRLDAAETT